MGKRIGLVFGIVVLLIGVILVSCSEGYEEGIGVSEVGESSEPSEKEVEEETPVGTFITGDSGRDNQIKVGCASLNKEKGLTTIVFNKECDRILKIKKEGEEKERVFDNVKEGGEFVLNDEGNLVEAKFTVEDSGRYKIDNFDFFVPKEGEVIFEDGKVSVTPKGKIGKGSELMPRLVDKDGETNIDLMYVLSDTERIFDLNGQRYGFKSPRGFVLGFDKHGGYIKSKEFNFEGIIVRDNKGSSELQKVYFDSKGKYNYDYEGSYLSINRNEGKVVIGRNKLKGEGPAFLFKDSEYFPDLEGEDDFISVQPFVVDEEPAFIHIEDRKREGKSTKLVTLNGVRFNQDKVSPYIDPKSGQVLLRRSNLIDEFPGSEGFVPFKATAYVYNLKDKKLKNIFGEGFHWLYGNDGLFVASKKTDFAVVRGASYGGRYPGLYKGASEFLVYYKTPNKENFERFTGVTVKDRVGVSSKTLKMLMDVIGNVPAEMRGSLNTLILEGGRWSYSGLAEWDGTIHLAGGGINPGTFLHELGHTRDFAVTSRFNKEWGQVRGYSGPQAYWYSYKNSYEKISTFREMINRNSWGSSTGNTYFSSWKSGLSNSYSHHKSIKARVALMYKYGFITEYEAGRVFGLGGLDFNAGEVSKYITEGKA